ncbi:arginine--tRNA ligase [bacterium]|nr:arginine--tRNA ligase [bacterium]
MPFFKWKEQLADCLEKNLQNPEVTAKTLLPEFTIPPNLEMGHLALPCFRMGKILQKPAGKLSQELAQHSYPPGITALAAGPYLNFKLSSDLLYQETLQQLRKEGPHYGSDSVGAGKKVIFEYCSPNIAKRLGFQHIRSTLIGNVLSNVYRHLGYDVTRINFIGDWGSQFARLVAAFEMWGDRSLLKPEHLIPAMDHLLQIYVKFHQELETHPELQERASLCLQKMEQGDPETLNLWKQIRSISTQAMDLTLKRMQVAFDIVEGESTYISKMDSVLGLIKQKTNAKISEGAWIVELPNISTPALIQKKDGTTLYLTRDIAGAIDRFNRFQFDRHYYIVSEQQRLHFQQLFGVLKMMGYEWAERFEHLSFGTVLFGSEKMSTREGRVILLDKLLDEAKELALAECTQKNPQLENKEQVAEMVGVGAIIFGELSTHRTRDMEFDWKSILSFEGETGPYVQYAAVRCRSLLSKVSTQEISLQQIPDTSQYSFSSEETALVLRLAQFRDTLRSIVHDNEPYHLTHYLIDVAKGFNRFYYKHPVLQATDSAARQIRLQLVQATGAVLELGLSLLGISCPEKM